MIFAGTAVRPARAFADVALLIDNRSRQAPAAFNGSDELEVSRRIERDLGSSYRINGKEVRQKDVQLLFADAASGAQSAALVSQGRIGSIVTAKPSDRRAILEEAAGIAGLHGRRKEAEQRLQAADANLTRLTDVTGQMEQQIATLGRQARQAERYRALSREIGTSEAMLAFRRWRDAADQLASTRGTLEVAQAKVQETARAAAGASARQAEMAAALPALRRREAEAAAQLQRLLRAADALDDERQRLAGRLADLERQRADLARDRQREDSLRADSAAAQARLAEEATTLEARLQQTQRQHDATVAAVAAAETAVRAAEQGFDALTARNADAQARKRAAEQRQASAEQRLTALAGISRAPGRTLPHLPPRRTPICRRWSARWRRRWPRRQRQPTARSRQRTPARPPRRRGKTCAARSQRRKPRCASRSGWIARFWPALWSRYARTLPPSHATPRPT
ncbi:hypothetical protein [Hankyongella ginsenosidimutans]|uniref:hypothetical protein n=1 Tax=Hankyongella ginsenosidimutans TaxID=1763828 RepID=UPI001FE67054|nr:hypothetical protein [Hankyongella ginsenosidimutans]